MWRLPAGRVPSLACTRIVGKQQSNIITRSLSKKATKGGHIGPVKGSTIGKKSKSEKFPNNELTKQMIDAVPPIVTSTSIGKGMDPYVRDIVIYIGAAATLLLGAATYKNFMADDSLEMEVFIQAKYLANRNKAVIDITGIPTGFEKYLEKVADDATTIPGKMVFIGTKGNAIVEYVVHRHIKDENGKFVFVSLDLLQEDGSRISLLQDNPRAPKTPEEEAVIKDQRKSELKELGSNLVLPGIGFFGAGCIAAYMILRILRNRPSYVIQLALDRLNTAPRVIESLGTPVKTNKNVYIGSITEHHAAFESKISGPKGEATMKVQAMRPKAENAPWSFSHLSLDIKGRTKKLNLLDKEMK